MHDPLNPEFSTNLQEALALGLKLAARVNNAAAYQAALHAFNARIHDGHAECGYACLDALDVFTRFDNTILVGAPSAGDSTYMEARYVTAPSGLARVVIPNKIWVGRTRRGGEGYFPAIELLTPDRNQADFITLIERDLSAKKP